MLTTRFTRARGVTLIELIVTMTVMGLLLAAAIPSVGSWMRNTQVRNAAESVQNGLQKARTEALRRNENVTFWLVSSGATPLGALISGCAQSSTSATWVVSIDDPTGHCTDAPSDTATPRLIEAHAQADGSPQVTTSAAQSDGSAATSVTFNGFGRTVGSTGIARFDFTYDDSRRLRVTVSPGGSVRMCDRDVSSRTDPRVCP